MTHADDTVTPPPAGTPTEALAEAPTEALAEAPTPASEAPATRRERRTAEQPDERSPQPKPARRGRILLIVGGAIVLVAALVAGALIAVNAHRAAQEEALHSAEEAALQSRAALDEAIDRVTTSAAALDELIAATDAAITVTGEGIDDDARAVFREAHDAAVQVQEADGTAVETDYITEQLPVPSDDLASATEAHLAQVEIDDAAAVRAGERADRLDDATAALDTAADDYLTATTASGAKVLADRGDASDDTQAALQSQLDSLVTADHAQLAAALETYRLAIDDVIASSEAARKPTPGGHGLRVPDPSSLTVVVNKMRGLDASYVPPGLVSAGLPGGAGPVRKELVDPLHRMRDDMAAEGITLRMSSAYRSYERQRTIYNGFVAREGVAGADTHSARPGNSEHQTGLAVDLYDDVTGCNLNVCFANTPGGKWLAENSWKYGFMLRYGDGWQPTVGFMYEPWHFRYVGVELATELHNTGVTTLEEYFGLDPAPDYR